MIWVAKGRKSPDETQTGSWLSSNGKLHNQQISGGFQVMRQGFLHFTNYGWSERNIKQNKEKAKKKKIGIGKLATAIALSSLISQDKMPEKVLFVVSL